METGKQILDKVKAIKESNSGNNYYKKTKATISGSLIGMAGGALLAYNKGYNLFTSAIMGAVIGGLVTHLILPNLIEDENSAVI